MFTVLSKTKKFNAMRSQQFRKKTGYLSSWFPCTALTAIGRIYILVMEKVLDLCLYFQNSYCNQKKRPPETCVLFKEIISSAKKHSFVPNYREGVCIPLRGNIPLGGNICYKWMKIKKINFKSIKISSCEQWN